MSSVMSHALREAAQSMPAGQAEVLVWSTDRLNNSPSNARKDGFSPLGPTGGGFTSHRIMA